MSYDKFKLDYELTDYGKLLFDFDGNVNGLDMSKERRKAMFRNPAFYYMLALAALLIIWYIASFISNAIKYGFLKSLSLHVDGIFVLVVMCLIIGLSAFGGWGKLIRFASRGKLTDVKGFNESEKVREEVGILDKNAIHIYEEYLVITNLGRTKAYYLDKVAKVILESRDKSHMMYTAKFVSIDGEEVESYVDIPREKSIIIQLKKIFGDKLTFKYTGEKKVAVLQRNKSIGSLAGLTLFVSIFILVGIGAIVLHFYMPNIPIILGVMFIGVGCIALCGVYDFIPALKDVLAPTAAGALFIYFPIAFAQLIYSASGTELTIKSFFSLFNILGAAVIFFDGLGFLFVLVGIKTAIDYIRYRNNK